MDFAPQFGAADVPSTDPVYCRQGECLYCDDEGCVLAVAQGDAENVDDSQAGANNDAGSLPELDQASKKTTTHQKTNHNIACFSL